MSFPIAPTNISIPAMIAPMPAAPQAAPGGNAFGSAFADAVSKVEGFQQNAQSSVERFLSGEGEELHHVALASQQAELSFQLFMQVRNKIVTAYQEVMRMQV
jgi:flagellar hook-basal body complex protein FliE